MSSIASYLVMSLQHAAENHPIVNASLHTLIIVSYTRQSIIISRPNLPLYTRPSNEFNLARSGWMHR